MYAAGAPECPDVVELSLHNRAGVDRRICE